MTSEETKRLLERDEGIYGMSFAIATEQGLQRIPPYEVTYDHTNKIYKWKGEPFSNYLVKDL